MMLIWIKKRFCLKKQNKHNLTEVDPENVLSLYKMCVNRIIE